MKQVGTTSLVGRERIGEAISIETAEAKPLFPGKVRLQNNFLTFGRSVPELCLAKRLVVASFPGKRRQAGYKGLLFESTGRAREHRHTGIQTEGMFYPCSSVTEDRKPCRAALPVSIRHIKFPSCPGCTVTTSFEGFPQVSKQSFRASGASYHYLHHRNAFPAPSSCSVTVDAETFLKKHLLLQIVRVLVSPWVSVHVALSK